MHPPPPSHPLPVPSQHLSLMRMECRRHAHTSPPLPHSPPSTSFVLVTGGGAFLLLAMFYELIDRRQWWSGAPFKAVGMNSIVMYCGSEIFADYFPFTWATSRYSHWGVLVSNCVGVSVWTWVASEMSKLGIFVKI